MKTRKLTKDTKHEINHFFHSDLCNDDMSYDDCEMAILKEAIKESEAIGKKNIVDAPNVSDIIKILEKFLVQNKLVCYGGSAINNILPKSDQFYDRKLEIPDYDFYSPHALDHAIELSDIYYKKGYKNVEAKAGVHYGTFKVYVNFIAIADITYLEKNVFESIQKEGIRIKGIIYAPPNFLRMNMYLELSRPAGDVSRWEKVLKRLSLLNRRYPLKDDNKVCSKEEFQRKMSGNYFYDSEKIYTTVKDIFIKEGVVFFGGYASSLYGQYMPNDQRNLISKIPDFDVLSIDSKKTSTIVCDNLVKNGLTDVKMIYHSAVGEIIPLHYEILIGKESIAFIYQTIACHSYNVIIIDDKHIKVATIDTMITFYLAFYYVDKPYYYQNRILCMTMFLFELEEKNRLKQNGLLKRFSITCYGKQMTKGDLRGEKNKKHRELKDKVGTREYDMWFLNYSPSDDPKIIYSDTKSISKIKSKVGKPMITKRKQEKGYSKTNEKNKKESEEDDEEERKESEDDDDEEESEDEEEVKRESKDEDERRYKEEEKNTYKNRFSKKEKRFNTNKYNVSRNRTHRRRRRRHNKDNLDKYQSSSYFSKILKTFK